jgi:putative protease
VLFGIPVYFILFYVTDTTQEATMSEVEVGRVTDYYTHLHVAAVEVTGEELHVGDEIHILGHTTDLMLKINSMQLNHKQIDTALPGQVIGIKCEDRVRAHDHVYVVH